MIRTMIAIALFLGMGVVQAKEVKKNDSKVEVKGKRVPSSESLVVRACDGSTPNNLDYFVETKTFEKEIRVFSVDTYGEPVCCSSHLIIFIPDNEEPAGSTCFHIATSSGGMGFQSVNLGKAKTTSDKSGTSITLPFSFYDGETGGTKQKSFTLLINQKNQSIQAGPAK